MKNINFSLFFKANLFITICLFLIFIINNDSYTILSFLLIILASISSATLLYFLVYIISFIFSYRNNIILYILGVVFFSINLSLIVDFFIYKIYKFHINAMIINIITSPDAMDSIQLGIAPIILFIGLILFFVFIEYYIIKKIYNFNNEYKYNLNKKLNKIIIFPLILIFLTEKISYGFASLFNKNDILHNFNVIPLYQPLTFNRTAYKYFGIKPDVQIKNNIEHNNKIIYPKNKININSNPNKINIFIIAFDAAKYSVINKNTSPNIENFKKDSIVFKNHYSGGNATRFGIFSLMYGVNSTYWFSFLNASKGSILFDILKKLDYDISIISSTNTSWPEFRKTAYVNIIDKIKDDFEGKPWQKDIQSSKYFINKIANYDKTKPIFSFLFMDSPHGYSFPKEYNKFNARDENINYLTVGKDSKNIKSVLSRYKNAIYFNDKLFGDIINKLKQRKLYKNSLIIFTSDHGQEFYEYGFFGHNSSFSKGQTHIPFIVKLPDSLKSKLKINDTNMLTSHIDVVPTLLNIIGIKNKSTDYSNGYNLFDKKFKRKYVFVSNWNNNAIITNDKTYVFSNLPNKMFKNEIRDTNTYKIIDNVKINTKLILEVMNENRQF